MKRVAFRRTFALTAFVVVLLGVTAIPASAHASLLSVDPQPGGVYDEAPSAINLRFNEPVEIALGGVRVFDGGGARIDVGEPTHPGGRGAEVRASLPDLDDGTYAVTWRVTSADAHPIEGAFTFQVGPEATVSNADGLAARLLAQQGGSTIVGVVYAIGRAVVFAALALLIGGALFLAVAFARAGLRRAAGVCGRVGACSRWASRASGLGASMAALRSRSVRPVGVGRRLDTRFGKVASPPRPVAARDPAREDAAAQTARCRGGGSACRGRRRRARGHARRRARRQASTSGSRSSRHLHVLAMACWIGGLVMLVAIVLVNHPPGLRTAVNRFSAFALGSVTVLVITGFRRGVSRQHRRAA